MFRVAAKLQTAGLGSKPQIHIREYSASSEGCRDLTQKKLKRGRDSVSHARASTNVHVAVWAFQKRSETLGTLKEQQAVNGQGQVGESFGRLYNSTTNEG
jgi:hypothetical protein